MWQGYKQIHNDKPNATWSSSEGQRRSINVQIMEHILATHAGITSKEIHFIGDNVEKTTLRYELRFSSFTIHGVYDDQNFGFLTNFSTIRFKRVKRSERQQENMKTAKKMLRQNLYGSGEERQTACLAAFDALSKTLRSLSDGKSDNALPLRITSVQVCCV